MIIKNSSSFFLSQLFFCGRSDYFRALLEYKHSEPSSPGKEEFNEPVAEVFLNDVPPDVFAAVVAYIYQDNALVKRVTKAIQCWK